MKLIIKANSSDEYTYCDYAIVDLNIEVIKDLVLRAKAVYKPEHRFAYYSISCPFECNFYQEGGDNTIEEEFINQDDKNYDFLKEEWSFQEVEDLDVIHSLKVQEDGDFWITAHGKYSNVIYETSIINIYEIEQTVGRVSTSSN
jgi:hypothetical protein